MKMRPSLWAAPLAIAAILSVPPLAKAFVPSSIGAVPSTLKYTQFPPSFRGCQRSRAWVPDTSIAASSSADDSAGDEEAAPSSNIDRLLNQMTSAFPLWVLGSAIVALQKPALLLWVNGGDLITQMLMLVMMGTGMSLEKKDFSDVLQTESTAIPVGVLCQFLIMPVSAMIVGRTLLLRGVGGSVGKALFLGLTLVGCSPGGTASNLVSLIAKADVALSVLLTACSTVLASAVTPLLVKAIVGSTIEVSGSALAASTAKVVLLPVLLGMLLNERAPSVAKHLSRFAPFASVVLVALICGGVVAQNAATIAGLGGGSFLPLVGGAVLLLHSLGFAAGYSVPRLGLGYGERTSRTISIETGMQNSALAVVLAKSIGADGLAQLPGALSATAHSCLGSILAAYWRYADDEKKKQGSG